MIDLFAGAGQCNGGKIGRLVNSLRGFVNVGIHIAESGLGQAFQEAFLGRVVNADVASPGERRLLAEAVLDEYGIQVSVCV